MPVFPSHLKRTPGRASRLRYLFGRVLLARRVLSQRLAGGARDRRGPLAVWPPLHDGQRLGDVENRVAWYLRHTGAEVLIPCSRKLLSAPATPPPAQQHYVPVGVTIRRVEMVRDADIGAYLLHLGGWRWLARSLSKATYLVDPDYSLSCEATEWFRLRKDLLPPSRHAANRERSLAVYRDFLDRTSGTPTAFVLTTGPSLDRVLDRFEFPEPSLRVVCNSAVKNQQIIQEVRPQVVTFADCAYHFGPSRYAAEFRRSFVEFMAATEAIAVVPEFCGDLLTSEFPDLASRIAAIPYEKGPQWNAPRADAFYVRPEGTILTQLMIPVAASVAPQILMAGADGRDPSDRFFWKHSSGVQFDDLMATVRDTHPSFFTDTDYEAYYDTYCEELESLIQWGEAQGMRMGTITPSHIPALQKRDQSATVRMSQGPGG